MKLQPLFAGLLVLFALNQTIVVPPALAAKPRTLTFRLVGEPETIDWNVAHTSVETYLLMNLMEGLVAIDSSLKPSPALAESWTRSKDGRTYTFRLRKGVQWSDGVPLKARDFVYSWKRLLSPGTAAAYAYFLFDVQGAEDFYKGKNTNFDSVGIKAPDDSTLIVQLTRPVAYWAYIPSFWVTFPMRQDLVEKYGKNWTKPGKIVTIGPFVLAAHEMESRIVLKANPKYYGTRGNLEQAIGLILKDDAAALNLYETHQIDFLTDISALDLKRMAGRPDLKTYPYLKTEFFAFSQNHAPVGDVHVRRAIAMAIDRKRIPEILHGGQTAATSFVPPQVIGYSKDLGLPYDPGKAKKELGASSIAGKGKLSLGLLVNNWDKQLTTAQFIQSELKKNLGIDVVIQSFDHKTFRAQLAQHVYPCFISSWGADYPDPDNFLSLFMSEAGTNQTLWKNPTYDQKLIQGRGMMDAKARERLYIDLQKTLLQKEAVIVPLYHEPILALVSKRVQGLKINPLNYLFLKDVSVE